MLTQFWQNHVKDSFLLHLVPYEHLLNLGQLCLHLSELGRVIQNACQDGSKQVVFLRVDIDGELCIVEIEISLIGLIVGFEEGDRDAAWHDAPPHPQSLLCNARRANAEDRASHVFMCSCYSLPTSKRALDRVISLIFKHLQARSHSQKILVVKLRSAVELPACHARADRGTSSRNILRPIKLMAYNGNPSQSCGKEEAMRQNLPQMIERLTSVQWQFWCLTPSHSQDNYTAPAESRTWLLSRP